MCVVLAALTIDTLRQIAPGSTRVPSYDVINSAVTYQYDASRGEYAPKIGGEELIFGHKYSADEATALLAKGKLVIQSIFNATKPRPRSHISSGCRRWTATGSPIGSALQAHNREALMYRAQRLGLKYLTASTVMFGAMIVFGLVAQRYGNRGGRRHRDSNAVANRC
jgi:hypothetical protein